MLKTICDVAESASGVVTSSNEASDSGAVASAAVASAGVASTSGEAPASGVSESPVNRKYKSTMYYNRRKVMPSNPTTLEEAKEYFDTAYVKGILTTSIDNKSVYHSVWSNDQSLIVIFASEEILVNLPETRYANITASMSVVPASSVFKVLLTVSVITNEDVSSCFEMQMFQRSLTPLLFFDCRLFHASLRC